MAALALIALTLAAALILVSCGPAARRLLVCLLGPLGVPIGLTLDLNGLSGGGWVWALCGTAAVWCASVDDDFRLRRP
jgi:hypothetical protein